MCQSKIYNATIAVKCTREGAWYVYYDTPTDVYIMITSFVLPKLRRE